MLAYGLMTANTEAQQPQAAAAAGQTFACTERLSTWIPPDIGRRLRHYAAERRQKLNHVLAEVLDRALPTDAEMADLLRGGATDDQH
jgi:hypothetical protein